MAKLIAHAHEQLLACPEQLAYLAGRGLPLEAVQRYRLGWLAQDAYRPRAAWGLPEALRDDGTPKKLWLPAGLVIPFCDDAGAPVRIRIRRAHIQPGQDRYYWVPGSGNDVQVLGRGALAFVVVESDLDGLLVHYHAGDLVNVIPLGSCATKPKAEALELLGRAKAILVALDADEAGGKSSGWWLAQFARARRWPTPDGKDPGEYVERGGDIRAWVLAGLPPVFHLAAAPAAATAAPATPANDVRNVVDYPPTYLKGTSKGGIAYLVAATSELLAQARELHPDAVPFLADELRHLKGYTPEEAHAVLLARQVFPEGRIVGSRPLTEEVSL
ncbi:hypothetical protein HGA89_01985 [bacterium]|nr:hypothetical protein [bacterium]